VQEEMRCTAEVSSMLPNNWLVRTALRAAVQPARSARYETEEYTDTHD